MIKRTVCARDCYDTCSLVVNLDTDNRIQSIQGDPDHPLTRGLSCPRGVKDHQRLYTNRVEAPHIRIDNVLRPCGWGSALDLISRKLMKALNDHGPESVLYLNYAGNTGLLTYTFPQRLWRAIQATFTDGALCSMSGHTALGLHYDSSYGAGLNVEHGDTVSLANDLGKISLMSSTPQKIGAGPRFNATRVNVTKQEI